MGSLISQTTRDLKRSFWFIAQGGCCYLRIHVKCQIANGAMCFDRGRAARLATWEHLHARDAGGTDADNLLLACNECNCLKANFNLATPADYELARAIAAAWRIVSPALVPQLSGAKAVAPIAVPLIDASSIRDKANAELRRNLMRAAGFPDIDAGPWIKGANGVKVAVVSPNEKAKRPAQRLKPPAAVQPKAHPPTFTPAQTSDLDARLARRGLTVQSVAERAASESLVERARALVTRLTSNKSNGPNRSGP